MAGSRHEIAQCPFQPGILPSGFEPVSAAVAMKQQDPVTSAGKASSGFRVLLVDDHARIRQGLRAMLEDHADLSVIGEAADGVEAVHLAFEIRPDVILMVYAKNERYRSHQNNQGCPASGHGDRALGE